MAKETIGIEALLHRAYAQYRVDKVTPAAVLGMPRFKPSGSLVGAMQALQLGTIIDNSGAAARMLGFQSMAAATPDDLLVVHDHVLALSAWLIEGAQGDEPQAWKRSEIAAQGWRVEDAASGLWLVRPGEEGAADAWSRLHDPFLTALVIEHARNGTRPDHGGPMPARRGRPDEAARAERAGIMLARAIYATWHAALGLLAVELDGVLLKHQVTGPTSPEAPWDSEATGNVLASQAGRSDLGRNSTPAKLLNRKANRRL
ncbi:hypothetical protein FQV39_28685 [Bosea sp. F3-2]|uniref:hypothetical protein n=1 Tax=Bosea sp. F3-2 TaxID=2599640 RepID=UPI0011F02CB2|nr:hypothetical protein [Bosea sp. F3-2]QEL26141.1 hypothetical protein FQV39_28685 [Bosea sp. F3-2]